MRLRFITFVVACIVSCLCGFSTAADQPSKRAFELVSQLTLEEKVSLLSGRDDWHVGGIPRLGLPLMRVSDCGHGVTLAAPPYGSTTCLPTSVGMASTWNEGLLFKVGELLGRETRAKGCGLLLGPMVNLHRFPLGGRNYETFSEDPLLAGKLAAALIRGIQSTGSGACVKALACNNQQKDQHATSIELDERTLRELYLCAFEITVRESQPWAIMTSYNDLRGLQTSENPHLLTDIVRQEWGFRGLIVSDWRAVRSTDALTAGLNLEMPGPGKQLTIENVRSALDHGKLTLQQLDVAVTPLVEILLRYDANRDGPNELDSPRHRAIARRAAEESIVLLKNDGLLPFDANQLKSLAVIGPNAAHARLGGGGSASVTPFYSVSPLDGLRALAGDRFTVRYAEGGGMGGSLPTMPAACLRIASEPDATEGLKAEFFDNPSLSGTPSARRIDPRIDFAWGWAAPMNGVPRFGFSARWSGYLVPPKTGDYKLSLVTEQAKVRLRLDGRLLLDGWDYRWPKTFEERFASQLHEETVQLEAGKAVPLVIEFSKTGPKCSVRLQWEPPGLEDPIKDACNIAAKCDAAVIFAGLCNIHEGGTQDRSSYQMPGRQVELIRRVAKVNPRTVVVLINGSVVSVGEWMDAAGAVVEAWYPGQEGGNALAAVLLGKVNPSGRLPDTIFRQADDILALKHYPGDGRRAVYAEAMNVGYRQLRPGGNEVLFPFGFGLSYSRFELNEASYDHGVTVSVSNHGPLPGSTVIQVFRQRQQPGRDDPWRELCAFRKIHLRCGETQTVRIPLTRKAFESWNVAENRWSRDVGITALWLTLDGQSGIEIRLPD